MFFFEVGVGFITRIVWGPKATLVAVGVGVSSYLSINIALLTPRNWLITTGKFYKKYFYQQRWYFTTMTSPPAMVIAIRKTFDWYHTILADTCKLIIQSVNIISQFIKILSHICLKYLMKIFNLSYVLKHIENIPIILIRQVLLHGFWPDSSIETRNLLTTLARRTP